MRRNWSALTSTALGSLLLLSACGSDTEVTTKSVEVSPAAVAIGISTTQAFSATAIMSDGSKRDVTTEATWASSDTAVATISSGGTATGVSAGTSSISATFDGQTGVGELTVTAATVVSVAVTPTDPTVAAGTTQAFQATATLSDSTTQDVSSQVTWGSSDTSIATIDDAGVATGVAAGSSTITATLGDVSGNTTMTVTAATLTSIEVTPTTPSIAAGTGQAFVATGTFSDSTTQEITDQVEWTSSDVAVATVSNEAGSKGVAAGLKEGSTTITATLDTVSGDTTLTVTATKLESIAVTPATPSIAKGSTQQFTATGTFTDGTTQDLTTQATWASADTAVATISNDATNAGLATAVDAGTSSISATVDGVSGNTELTVTAATLVSIEVTPSASSTAKGSTVEFTATGTYTDTTTQDLTDQVTWASSNADAATISNAVDSEGVATAVAEGSTTISATLGDISGDTTLAVTAATLVSITITPSAESRAKGTTVEFTATGTYTDTTTQDVTKQVTWASSNTDAATISNATDTEGHATTVDEGTTTISATLGDVSGDTTLTVTAATLVSITVTPAAQSRAKGTTVEYTATGTYTDNSTQDLTKDVTWASSDEAIATISNATDSEGFASTVAEGTTTISATSGDVSGDTTLMVTAATLVSIEVTPTAQSVAKGSTVEFKATGTYTDNSTQDLTKDVTWASSAESFVTISNATDTEGFASAVAVGTSTISATSGTVSGTTTLAVTAATLVSIAVTPPAASRAKGTTVQYMATGTYTDTSTQDLTKQVTWASSAEGIATISNATDSEGNATTVDVGSTTISATLGTVSGDTTLTVTAATLVSIAVTSPTNQAAKGTTVAFTAVGTYTDTSTQDITTEVTWKSSVEGVATISNVVPGNGQATALSEGTTNISATMGTIVGQVALEVTSAVVKTVNVTPANPSIAPNTVQWFTAHAVFTDNTVQEVTTDASWNSATQGVATISNVIGEIGLARSVMAGTSVISASYDGVTGQTTLTVTAATLSTITVALTPDTLPRGNTSVATATGTFSDGSTQDLTQLVTWESDDTDVATISNAAGSKGAISSVDPGSANIKATYLATVGSKVVTVTPAQLVSIAVTPPTSSAARGTGDNFTATGTYTDNSTQDLTTTVSWSSSDETVASISNAPGTKGEASALNVGSTTITARSGTVSGTATFRVTPATLVSIAVTPPTESIAKGFNKSFTATGTYSDATTQDLTQAVTWASDDTDVATVSNASGSHGLVSSEGVGTAKITATLGTINGSAELTVTAAVLTAVNVTPPSAVLADGTTRQFSATAIYSDNTTQPVTTLASWSSGNENAATVGTEGLVTAVDPGTAGIKATYQGISGTSTVTVTPATLVSISITPTNPDAARGTQVEFEAFGAYTDGSTQDLTDQVTWASDDTHVATISNAVGEDGHAQAANVGTAKISATLDGVTGDTMLTVTAATLVSIAVTPPNHTLPEGLTVAFAAEGTYTDGSKQDLTKQVTWESDDTDVASISNATDSEGVATAIDPGSVTITATLGTVKNTATLSVTAAQLISIAVTPANDSLPKGFALKMKAEGTYTDNSKQDLTTQVTWNSSNETVAFISNSAGSEGQVTGINNDTTPVVITATLGTVSGMTNLTVTPATLQTIEVTPANPQADVDTTKQFTAEGTFSDNSKQDLTDQVSWVSDDPTVVTILTAGQPLPGLATAVKPGKAKITATLNTVSGSTEMTVTAINP